MADLPPAFVLSFAALFGLAVGSFLNVCIYRVPRDMSVMHPRSFCPSCEVPVTWYDNFPLLSYLLLRGRCRSCRATIGASYVLVEILAAITFVLVVHRYGLSLVTAKWILYECLLIILFWTDWQERLLPDEFTLGGATLGLVFAFLVYVPGLLGEFVMREQGWKTQSLANAVLGGLFAAVPIWLLGYVYEKLRGQEGLGFGDVKLLFLIGVFLGPENALSALTLGATAGAIFGLIQLAFRRKEAWSYALPFGSFLSAGAYLIPLVSRLSLTSVPLARTG